MANKIAAGEVVERPASVAKELIENALDAGATRIVLSLVQGGRGLVAVQDDGCGMTKADAVLALERQATSKIRDVDDIESIDTLGFRGEAIPSIASVSRFTLTTRRADSDEGTRIKVNAGTLAEVSSAGCPPGTLVEVRDLFCNVPARRKFLRAYTTEENHVKQIFTLHALAHHAVGFTLIIDGREFYRLPPTPSLDDRIRELFGADFLERAVSIHVNESSPVKVSGYIERPNLSTPVRHDQYIFINGRPASAPSIAYALREAYPRQSGDNRPAAVLFIDLPPGQVDVNVHPTKREVRFRDTASVKAALIAAIEGALASTKKPLPTNNPPSIETPRATPAPLAIEPMPAAPSAVPTPTPLPTPAPIPMEFAIEPDSTRSKPWQWFRYLAQSASGYLLIETDSGIVTINPIAARERIAYEHLLAADAPASSQALLIPETIHLPPVAAARIRSALPTIRQMGFQLDEFGSDTFKIDAIPQLIGTIPPSDIISTIAHDLAEGGSRRGGERWREELVAKSIARSFARSSTALTADGATKLIESLCTCSMPYVCPRGKPVMIFTSTRELNRRFDRV